MSEWQPIETAPKDGSHVLLYCDLDDDRCFVGLYDASEMPPQYDRTSAKWRSAYPYGPFVWRCVQDGGVAEDLVTHWAPLPEPPK